MVHLHVHSNHSLLEGVAPVGRLIERAAAWGMGALALTDTGGMYGAIPFYQAARAAGIKPILGVELNGTVFLARNREGYAELCRLITERGRISGETSFHGKRNFPGPLQEKRTDDFYIEKGPSADSIVSNNVFILAHDEASILTWHARGMRPLVALAHYGDSASFRRTARGYALAKRLGLKPVAAIPVYLLEPEQMLLHRVLTAIRLNTTIGALGEDDAAHSGAWFRSPEEMARLYAAWPDALANTGWVAERCNVELPMGKPLFPRSELPSGETAFSYLWQQAFDGARTVYRPLTPRVIQRLQYELDVIHDLGFAPYFLIVWDIVRHARAEGIPIVGRGSAANSLVAHVLGITRADPFKYDLYFERFLNRSRTDCPDIDLDICWRRRDDVIGYVYRKYGMERVAMIATFNTFQARSALRETAKAFGWTDAEIGPIVRRIPHYHASDIRTLIARIPECRGLDVNREPLKSILAISETLDGFPRHLSIHSGGLVIAPEPLTRFTPLQCAAKGIQITQYDMHAIEALGLIKMDLLGHRSLTVIDDAVKAVRANRDIALDIEALPDPDPLTTDCIRAGRTIGCFQIESPAMRSLLKSTGADSTDMLIKTLSLVRPGPSGSGMKQHFIDRHRGREPVTYPHPALETALRDTYGVMLYQEDILKAAHLVADMDLGEADAFRRAMTKTRDPQHIAAAMKRLCEKAVANGVASEQAESIGALMANFAEYSYCKAHASTYGEIAYQCAYLKAHFPAEFFAGVLSNRGGFYHPAVYIEEARHCGVSILPPDVNASQWPYTAEDGALRVGFIEIRQLAYSAVKAILDARADGPFDSFADLIQRTCIAPSDAETLIQAGACDGLGETRPEMIWTLKTLARSVPPGGNGAWLPMNIRTMPAPHRPNYARRKKSDDEWASLGLLVTTHPLEYYAPATVHRAVVASNDLAAYTGKTVSMLGWLIAERRVGLKGRGVMKFLTLQDMGGVFEGVLFPKAYERYGRLLTSQGPYLLTGGIQEENGCHSLIVEKLERPGARPPTVPFRS